MSQASELLNSVTESAAGTATEGNIVIGRDRYIVVPDTLKKVGVQYDHNVETVTFDCPRYWDDWDLSKMKIYVNYMRADGVLGAALCENVIVDASNSELVHFDWTISGHITEVAGQLSFLVCIKNVESNGTERTHWNSELNTDMYISVGLKCQETILRRYPDIITQLLVRMDDVDARTTPEELRKYVSNYLIENEDEWISDMVTTKPVMDKIDIHLANEGVKTFVDIEIGTAEPDHACLWFDTDEENLPHSDLRDNFEVAYGPEKPNYKCLWLKTKE